MKLKIEIDEAEYKTLSKLSETEKVNELSYYERAIANGVPTKDWVRPAGEWIKETRGTFRCSECNRRIRAKYNEIDEHMVKIVKPRFCDNCGAYMVKENDE